MNRSIVLILIVLFKGVVAQSQDPAEKLKQWSQERPIEKVYLHLDRGNYIAGQTIWFKAYLLSEYFPDTISTNLYVELTNQSGGLIGKRVVPVLGANSQGEMEITDSLPSAWYILRAYTPYMLSVDSQFIYSRSIFIYGKNSTANPSANAASRIEYFPEGGNLVNGQLNTVAFKITGDDGLPVEAKGSILDESGARIASFTTYHDGMGMFEFTPQQGHHYRGVIDGKEGSFDLPKAIDNGVLLTCIPHPQGYFFELKQAREDAAFEPSYMIGQMQNRPVFRKEFGKSNKEWQGVINTMNLHSGIMQVTVFNKSGMPLAERLCFVNNKEYLQPAKVEADTLNLSPRGKNKFRISMPDTVQGTLSVSVTDPAFETGRTASESILSEFLLTSDLRGYIHNPSWYFNSDDDSVKASLDLLMMVNGWRRFQWTEIVNGPLRNYPAPDRGFISIGGRAFLRGTKKAFANRSLLMLLYDAWGKRIIQLTSTDNAGNFHIDSLLIFGKARMIFSDIKGKKSDYIDVFPAADSIWRNLAVPTPDASWALKKSLLPAASFANDYDAILKANGIMLGNVTVKAVKKSPLQEVDDRYTKGAFSGFATRSIDLVNSDEADPYNNIFDYLQSRVIGLNVTQDGSDYSVYYRQQANVSAMGAIPMVLFLDEVETDASMIAAIPANQVALVKVFDHFAGATGNAPGGALAIYTKTGKDYIPRKGPVSFGVYNGYSVVKEFYAPDYSVKKDDKTFDNRITLDWRPSITCNYVNPSIPFSFYNNDRTRSFHIVVEGMTLNGKLIHIDRVFEAPSKK